MSRARRVDNISLRSFGAVIGLIFVGGGSAEIVMSRVEMSRILGALRDYEKGKNKPDEKLVAALDVVCRKAHGRFDRVRVVAEVPIAARKARITPIIEGLPERPRLRIARTEAKNDAGSSS